MLAQELWCQILLTEISPLNFNRLAWLLRHIVVNFKEDTAYLLSRDLFSDVMRPSMDVYFCEEAKTDRQAVKSNCSIVVVSKQNDWLTWKNTYQGHRKVG